MKNVVSMNPGTRHQAGAARCRFRTAKCPPILCFQLLFRQVHFLLLCRTAYDPGKIQRTAHHDKTIPSRECLCTLKRRQNGIRRLTMRAYLPGRPEDFLSRAGARHVRHGTAYHRIAASGNRVYYRMIILILHDRHHSNARPLPEKSERVL